MSGSTINNCLISLTQFISFGIDIKHFKSRRDACDFKDRVNRWKLALRKDILEHNINRKQSEASKLINTLLLINYALFGYFFIIIVFFLVPLNETIYGKMFHTIILGTILLPQGLILHSKCVVQIALINYIICT